MNRILAGVAVATVAGLTACGGSEQTPATSHTTVPPSVSAAKAVTAAQVAAAAGGTSCKSETAPSGAVSAVTCTLPNGDSMLVTMFGQSFARDGYVSSDLQQSPGDQGYWVEGQPSTRWAIKFNSIKDGPADAHSVAVKLNGIQIGSQPGQ
jgi:hypothetical protein